MALIGYARVSTREQGQSIQTQTEQLCAAGCLRVFSDTMSGATRRREGLSEALAYIREGDTLTVTRLDRLGRTTLDTLRTIEDLNSRGIPVRVLSPEVDTTTPSGRLVVQVMASLAEYERGLLIERVREGVAAAAADGRVGGRPRALTVEQERTALTALSSGQSMSSVARSLGVSRHTIRRLREREILE